MRGAVVSLSVCVLGSFVAGCPSSSPGGNTNRNDNSGSSYEQSVELELTTNGEFDLAGGAAVEHRFAVSILDTLGMSTLDAFAVVLDPADVVMTAAGTNGIGTNGIGTNGIGTNGAAGVDVLVGALDDETVCAAGISLGRFELNAGTNGEIAVEPRELSASASALDLLRQGEFEMCLRARSETDQRLTLDRLTLLFDTTVPVLNCSQILALPQFQAALDLLAEEDLEFVLHRGSAPPDITGTYAVAHSVDFDPDGSDGGELPNRSDTFRDQAGGTITRASGRATLEQFITGTQDAVSLCVLGRTNNRACDQTIARIESYDVGTNGIELNGTFLAVVVTRHPSDDPSCGEDGDFIFGSIRLTRQGTTVGPTPDDGTSPTDTPDPLDDVPDPLDDAPPDPLDEPPPDPLENMPDPLEEQPF